MTNDELHPLYSGELPPTATLEEILAAIDEATQMDLMPELSRTIQTNLHQRLALKLGLPATATVHETQTALGELKRQRRAKKLGLPPTAPWDEIQTAGAELERQRRAKELGLPPTAPWSEIRAASMELRRKRQ